MAPDAKSQRCQNTWGLIVIGRQHAEFPAFPGSPQFSQAGNGLFCEEVAALTHGSQAGIDNNAGFAYTFIPPQDTISSALVNEVKCKFCAAEPVVHAVPYSGACLQCSIVRADREYLNGDGYVVIPVPDCVRVYVSKRAMERVDKAGLDEFQARIQEVANRTTKSTISLRFFGMTDDQHEFWIRIFANDPTEHVVFVTTDDEGVEELLLTV